MSNAARTPPHIRRIVTGHDANGKSVVWLDGPATNHKYPDDKLSATLMWVTDQLPADYTANEDAGNRITGTAPPPGGTRLAVIELQPGNTSHGLHHTDTIDYVICMSGEVEMELDASTVKMKAGDVLIQRGTNHGWVNRSNAPARIAVMLTDARPKRGDSVAGTQNAR
jgi:quercetin dioxygenase-like cupin family protein